MKIKTENGGEEEKEKKKRENGGENRILRDDEKRSANRKTGWNQLGRQEDANSHVCRQRNLLKVGNCALAE